MPEIEMSDYAQKYANLLDKAWQLIEETGYESLKNPDRLSPRELEAFVKTLKALKGK